MLVYPSIKYLAEKGAGSIISFNVYNVDVNIFTANEVDVINKSSTFYKQVN